MIKHHPFKMNDVGSSPTGSTIMKNRIVRWLRKIFKKIDRRHFHIWGYCPKCDKFRQSGKSERRKSNE